MRKEETETEVDELITRLRLAAKEAETSGSLEYDPGLGQAANLIQRLCAGLPRIHNRTVMNSGKASFSAWWAMIQAEAELIDKSIPDDAVVLHYMGCGASHQVTAKDIRDMLAEKI